MEAEIQAHENESEVMVERFAEKEELANNLLSQLEQSESKRGAIFETLKEQADDITAKIQEAAAFVDAPAEDIELDATQLTDGELETPIIANTIRAVNLINSLIQKAKERESAGISAQSNETAMSAKMDALTKQSAELEATIQQWEGKSRAESATIIELEQEVTRQTRAAVDAKGQIKEMQEQLQMAQLQDEGNHSTSDFETSELQRKLERSESRARELTASLKQATVARDELGEETSRLRQTNHTLVEDNNALEKQVERLGMEGNDAESMREAQFQAKIAAAAQEGELQRRHDAEVQRLAGALAAAEKATLEQKVEQERILSEAREQLLQQHQQDAQQLREQTESGTAQQLAAALEGRRTAETVMAAVEQSLELAHAATIAEMRTTLSDAQQAHQVAQRESAAELATLAKTLAKSLADAASQRPQASLWSQEKLSQLLAEVAALQSALAKSQAKSHELDAELQAAAATASSLRDQLAQQVQAPAANDSAIFAIAKMEKRLVDREAEFEKGESESFQENLELEAKLEQAMQKEAASIADAANLTQLLTDATTAQRAQNTRVSRLTDNNSTYRVQIEELRTQLLSTKVRPIGAGSPSKRAGMGTKTKKRVAAQLRKISDLEGELSSVKSVHAELEDELSSAKSVHAAAVSEHEETVAQMQARALERFVRLMRSSSLSQTFESWKAWSKTQARVDINDVWEQFAHVAQRDAQCNQWDSQLLDKKLKVYESEFKTLKATLGHLVAGDLRINAQSSWTLFRCATDTAHMYWWDEETDAYSLSPPAEGVSGAEDESVSEFEEGMRLLELAQSAAK